MKNPKKLSQKLTPLQYQKLKQHIPDGDRQRVISVLIDGLIELMEQHNGPLVLGAILSKKVKVSTILDAGIQLGQSIEHDRQRERSSAG